MARAWLLRVRGPAYRRAGSDAIIEGDLSTTEETSDDPAAARSMAANRRGVPLSSVEHVLDENGSPVVREYVPIRGAYGAALGSRYDRDNELEPAPEPGNRRGKAFF